MFSHVSKLFINLIGDHHQVAGHGYFRNFQQIFPGNRRPGGVVRITQEQNLRCRGNGFFHHFRGYLKAVFHGGFQVHRGAPGQGNTGGVRYVGRLGN
ncbi:MAG: hypothetical protein BWY80_01163 [Firmicutes bacterium ADurb.Bin456]|nr:MAG: hypothetical protein BWY80_01163 [Firmicutes bacterium ADurb.Bin456]